MKQQTAEKLQDALRTFLPGQDKLKAALTNASNELAGSQSDEDKAAKAKLDQAINELDGLNTDMLVDAATGV